MNEINNKEVMKLNDNEPNHEIASLNNKIIKRHINRFINQDHRLNHSQVELNVTCLKQLFNKSLSLVIHHFKDIHRLSFFIKTLENTNIAQFGHYKLIIKGYSIFLSKKDDLLLLPISQIHTTENERLNYIKPDVLFELFQASSIGLNKEELFIFLLNLEKMQFPKFSEDLFILTKNINNQVNLLNYDKLMKAINRQFNFRSFE